MSCGSMSLRNGNDTELDMDWLHLRIGLGDDLQGWIRKLMD